MCSLCRLSSEKGSQKHANRAHHNATISHVKRGPMIVGANEAAVNIQKIDDVTKSSPINQVSYCSGNDEAKRGQKKRVVFFQPKIPKQKKYSR
jgi:hypothetical protein